MEYSLTTMAERELASGYYLTNFRILIDFVNDRYSALFHEPEQAVIRTFQTLSDDAARLYVRLILRVGPCFREDKLRYTDIACLDTAIDELARQHLLRINHYDTLTDWLSLFTKPELLALAPTLGVALPAKTISKPQLMEVFLAAPETDVAACLCQQTRLLFPTGRDVVTLLKLLFFGNLHQDMSEFILEDLGVLRFEPYPIREEDRLFTDRSVVDQTLELIALSQCLYDCIQAKELAYVIVLLNQCEHVPELPAKLLEKRNRMILKGARFLESAGATDLAFHYYETTQIPPARERQARILDKQGLWTDALHLCDRMQHSHPDQSEQEFLAHFPDRLKRKLNRPYKKQTRKQYPTLSLQLLHQPAQRVEEQALAHFHQAGYAGFYTENVLWNGLYGLYFWDVIFSAAPGAFFNPYQRGPKDLYSSQFIANRGRAFPDRLAALHKSDYCAEILSCYDTKFNTANLLVNWKQLTRAQLELALSRLPTGQIAAIFEKMSLDLRANSAGFPDLFLVKDGRCLLLEVKSPNDQLQPSQKRWFDFFDRHSIPYQVARVTWT